MNKIQCPNCKNYKIKSSKATAWALLVIGIATIIFGIGIIFLLMGFVAFSKKTEYSCEVCGFKFNDNTKSVPATA